MNTFLITATCRNSGLFEPSGYLFTIDLSGRVTGRCPVIEPPHREADPNPRGGMRGAKGIAVVGDERVFVANASVIHGFDPSWQVVSAVSHPSCASLHDIVHDEGTLWVTSCSNDLLCRLDLAGRLLEVFSVREHLDVCRGLGWHPPRLLDEKAIRAGAVDFRDPRTHRAEVADGAHLNSVCFLPGGDRLLLLGLIRSRRWTFQLTVKNLLKKIHLWQPAAALLRPLLRGLPLARVPRGDLGASLASGSAAVLRLDRHGRVTVVHVLKQRRVPTHSLLARPDGTVLLADTTAGEIVHLDPEQGERSRLKVTDTFLRGLCPLDNGLLLAGAQNEVLLVDLERRLVLERTRLTDNPRVSVFDIKPLPPLFAPLPPRLTRLLPRAVAAPG